MVKISEQFVGEAASPRLPARARGVGADGGQSGDVWTLEPHICRACFSRLVSQDAGADGRRYHCTNCGLDATGDDAGLLCCCGTKIRRPNRGARSGHQLVDAGIRCAPNPAPTPDFPSLFIAIEAAT